MVEGEGGEGGLRVHQRERSRAAARGEATLEAECGLRRPSRWRALYAGELSAERSHQLLAVKRLPDAVFALTIVHEPFCFRGA